LHCKTAISGPRRAGLLFPAAAFVALFVALPSCRGKHSPPPGFVRPEVVKGYASLIVRIEDGAWAHQSGIGEVETLHPAGRLAGLFAGSYLLSYCMDGGSHECKDCAKTACGAFSEGDFDICKIQTPALNELQEEIASFLEGAGFEFSGIDDYPADGPTLCKGGEWSAEAGINAVRICRILSDLFSPERDYVDENADDKIVNFIYSRGEVGGSDEEDMCGLELPSEGENKWFVGWMPCREPRYVVAVHGREPCRKAQEVVEILDF